jgi:hypothetical protein
MANEGKDTTNQAIEVERSRTASEAAGGLTSKTLEKLRNAAS